MTGKKTPCLIPVRVTACVFDPQTLSRTKEVRKEGGALQTSPHTWAWHAPNYDRLDSNRTEAFDRIWPSLFESVTSPVMGKRGGVCLTIAPPSGFSKPLDDNEMGVLPHLPDRYLWVRIVRRMHDANGQWVNETPSVHAWIIDAGVQTDNPESAPVLTSVDGKMTACHLGVQRSLDEAQSQGPDERRIPLHVQGTDQCASVTFAAYSPANMNNTSCIDTLDDISPDELQHSAISYFVVGWYRDPEAHDPVAKQEAAGKTDDEIRHSMDLNDDTASARGPLGNRCFIHGLVTHIDYWNGRSYLGPAFGSPLSEPVHPCVGTFHHDPQKIGFGATAEDALSALLSDLSPDDDGDKKLAADFYRLCNALLHDRLNAWNVVGSDDTLRHAQQSTTFYSLAINSEWAIGPAEKAQTPSTQGKTFDLTNEQQSTLTALNGLQSDADKARCEFEAAAEALYATWWQTLRARGRRKSALEQATNRQAEIAELFRNDNARQLIAIEAARERLQASLDTQFGQGIAEVKNFPTKSFYLPKEPAVAIRNVGPRVPPYPDKTTARTIDETANARARGTYDRLTRAPIRAALRAYADADFDSIFDALAEEAALVEEAIASLMRDGGQVATFDKNSNVDQWEERNRRVRTQERGIEFSTANGRRIALSDLSSAWCRQPWIPLFLDWEVEWFPASDQTATSNGTLLSGRTILASRPQSLIRSRLEHMGKMNTNVTMTVARCRHLLDEVIEWDVLAQSLSGFHQQLLLRDDLLPRVLPTDEPLRSLVERTTLAPPNLAPNLEFDTLRRGSAKVRRLWVVDSFGQAFSLDPIVKTATKALESNNSIPLDVRLLEPHRLSVEFDHAPDAQNPIRGWILWSIAEKTLVVYDGRGNPLGIISRIASSVDTEGTSWRPAMTNSPKTPSDIDDPVLAAFLRPLVGGADALRQLNATLAHIDEALARTLPPQSSAAASPASMLGRPLVLVQASIRIERRGDSMMDPAAPSTDIPQIAPLKARIWIGARSLPDDAVIGFQFGDTSSPLRRTAKLVYGPPDGPPSFTLETPGASEAVPVTLLMDPQGAIYIESDILPVLKLRLPPEWIDDIAQRLPAVLRVAPALIHSHALLRSILVPNESSSPASIDLPLPIASTQNAPNGAHAVFSMNGGIVVPVKPFSTTAVVPERQVAAIEGVLIL